MLRVVILFAFLVVLVVVGCGGSTSEDGAAPAVGATEPAPTSSSETASPETSEPEPPDPAEELAAYLEQVGVEQREYEKVRERVLSAFDGVDTSGPNQSWVAAGNELRDARDAYNELAVRMKALEPPAELADAHDDLAQSLQLFGQFVDDAQTDLRDKNLTAVLGWEETLSPLGTRINELRGNWRTETLAYARKIGADVPAWVSKVGTRG